MRRCSSPGRPPGEVPPRRFSPVATRDREQRVVTLDVEDVVTNVDPVGAPHRPRRRDLAAVEVGPVGALEVEDHVDVRIDLDELQVVLRHVDPVEHQVVVILAADEKLSPLKEKRWVWPPFSWTTTVSTRQEYPEGPSRLKAARRRRGMRAAGP